MKVDDFLCGIYNMKFNMLMWYLQYVSWCLHVLLKLKRPRCITTRMSVSYICLYWSAGSPGRAGGAGWHSRAASDVPRACLDTGMCCIRSGGSPELCRVPHCASVPLSGCGVHVWAVHPGLDGSPWQLSWLCHVRMDLRYFLRRVCCCLAFARSLIGSFVGYSEVLLCFSSVSMCRNIRIVQ